MSSVDTNLAAAALAIALIAFVTAFGQLMQQYFATADGYRRCQRSVMGGWATKTRLRWRWREFRFETLYTTPEIFMAGGNMPAMDYFAYNGIMWSKREDFVLITGSHRSLSQTFVLPEQTGPNVHKVSHEIVCSDSKNLREVELSLCKACFGAYSWASLVNIDDDAHVSSASIR